MAHRARKDAPENNLHGSRRECSHHALLLQQCRLPWTVTRGKQGVNIHDDAKIPERRRKGRAMGLTGRAWRPVQRQGQALHDREDFTTFFDIKPFGIMKYPSYVALREAYKSLELYSPRIPGMRPWKYCREARPAGVAATGGPRRSGKASAASGWAAPAPAGRRVISRRVQRGCPMAHRLRNAGSRSGTHGVDEVCGGTGVPV